MLRHVYRSLETSVSIRIDCANQHFSCLRPRLHFPGFRNAKLLSAAAWLLALYFGLTTLASAQMVMDVDHEMAANQASTLEYTEVECGEGGAQSMPAGDYNTDLHIVGQCNADGVNGGGIYKYHWIFIHNNGVLTLSNMKLDVYASSILVLNGGTLQAGSPTDPITAAVTIHLWGSQKDPAINCQTPKGASDDECGIPHDIWISNKMDLNQPYPTKCDPNPEDPRGDCFYQYDNPEVSNLYFGRKVLAVSYGGTLQLFGKKGSTFDGLTPDPSNTGTSWRRLATNIKPGAASSTFDVDGVVDWEAGDHIVITPTDYLPGHAEEAIIQSVEPNGDNTTITTNAVVLDSGNVQTGGLRYPHYGETYKLPSDVQQTVGRSLVETRAAVALLSRDIRVVSEGNIGPDTSKGTAPNFPPTPGNFFGGHVIFRQGFKQIQVQGVEFDQLGQGGVKGRYAVHFHMTRKVPLDTFIKDSTINESMTRWITLHGVQGVLLDRNVGWKSIGHGFYIEDGTETDNKLYANIGILARAGIKNSQNPREVPGLLAHPDLVDPRDPYSSDWQHPSVFWIMNGWNDFQYNMAVAPGTCGVCYWVLSAANSGPSRYEAWTGYASRQRGISSSWSGMIENVGTSPLENFSGNSCSTAMYSFMSIGEISTGCEGFGTDDNSGQKVAAIPGAGPDIPRALPNGPPKEVTDYYPIVSGLRHPAQCTDLNGDCGALTSANHKCVGVNNETEKNCVATVIDHFTTSFNFSLKNFSSIWLRQWWYLVTDSSITDQLGAGLTFVTGGGFTRSDSAIGDWNVGLRDVYVGQTQKQPAKTQGFFASDLGPFTEFGLNKCDNGQIPGSYCLSKDSGIAIPITPFNAGQRMFNIYDGPSAQDSSAYLDIKADIIPDCTSDKRDGGTGKCNGSKYMYGHAEGLLQGVPEDPEKPDIHTCYIPNAAIAWKQENGFYYPPAFFSRNLIFRDVDIRHFVIEPLFELNTFNPDYKKIATRYCTWTNAIFTPFNDIDRQTVLNDIDGSLTGLVADTTPPRETLSINEDAFFRAPNVVPECASDKHEGTDQTGPPATAITSPYEYLTTVIFPDCVYDAGEKAQCGKTNDQPNWTFDGTHAFGVPLFRQYWTAEDYKDCGGPNQDNCLKDPLKRPGRITMMGQATGQRSTLTPNHGWYYIDDTIPASQQTGVPQQNGRSVFLSGHTYYVFLIYGNPDTVMDYWMYIGKDIPDEDQKVEKAVRRVRMNVDGGNYRPTNVDLARFPDFITPTYEPSSGWLKVHLDMSKYGCDPEHGITNCEFVNDRQNFCKPVSYCSWNSESKSCGCKEGSGCADNSVCAWGPSDIDCPTAGCFGFGVFLYSQFDQPNKPGPPPVTSFPKENYVDLKAVGKNISGEGCYYGEESSPAKSKTTASGSRE